MQLSNKVYDVLKWIVVIVLPALSAAYFALAGIWNLPYAEQVVGTVAVITTLLGALLGLSTASYNKSEDSYDGKLLVNTADPSKDTFTIDLGSTTQMYNGQTFRLKVEDAPVDGSQ